MDDDELRRLPDEAGAQFEAAKVAMGVFASQLGRTRDPRLIAAAFDAASESGIGAARLLQGLGLVAYFGYERAAELSGRTVEEEAQEHARHIAFVVERFHAHQRGET